MDTARQRYRKAWSFCRMYHKLSAFEVEASARLDVDVAVTVMLFEASGLLLSRARAQAGSEIFNAAYIHFKRNRDVAPYMIDQRPFLERYKERIK